MTVLDAHAGVARYFSVFAPAILACDGDPAREDATLGRPGVSAAKRRYDACVRVLVRAGLADQAGGLHEAHRQSTRVSYALAVVADRIPRTT